MEIDDDEMLIINKIWWIGGAQVRRNLLVSNKAVEIRESVESDLNSINLHLSVKVELISILSFT